MNSRLFSHETQNENLKLIKNEWIELLNAEEPSCYEAKRWFEHMIRTLSICDTEDETLKTMIGALTMSFLVSDAHTNRGNRNSTSKSVKPQPQSKYSADQILNVLKGSYIHRAFGHDVDPNKFRQFIDFQVSTSMLKAAFLKVADFVLANPLGCDDFDKTKYLKTHSLIKTIPSRFKVTEVSIPMNTLVSDDVEETESSSKDRSETSSSNHPAPSSPNLFIPSRSKPQEKNGEVKAIYFAHK